MTDSPDKPVDYNDIQQAIRRGTQNYFQGCRQRVPSFVNTHFFPPGSWHTNKVALGFDLLRAPLNLFWAPFYALTSALQFLFRRLGWSRTAKLLNCVPAGFTTRVQKHLAQQLYSDLLKLSCEHSRLERHIAKELQELYQGSHKEVNDSVNETIEHLVHEALMQYRITRTAASDITNTITSTLIGAFAFYKFTPGGIGIGILLATVLAKYLAVKDFFLGETLGSIYFYLFPPEPAFSLTVYSTLAVMAILSVFASFSGLLTDPIQALLRLHHKRLYKMLDHLERDFLREQEASSYRPKDQYLARLLDMFDVVKSHLY